MVMLTNIVIYFFMFLFEQREQGNPNIMFMVGGLDLACIFSNCSVLAELVLRLFCGQYNVLSLA